MSYAETLPEPIIKICRWLNAGCLIFTVLACLDIYVLPHKIYHEKILDREEIYITTRSRYSNQSHTQQMDNVILYTENFRYPYHRVQQFNPREADSIRLVTTRLFKIVKTGYQKSDGVEKELKQGAGMFGTFAFLPIAFGLISVFGVAMRHNKEQLLNAAVFNLILMLVQLWVYAYF